MRHLEAAQLVQAERLQRSTIGVGEIVAHISGRSRDLAMASMRLTRLTAGPAATVSRRHQPPRQFVDGSCEGADLPDAAGQPFDDRSDGVVSGPLCDRAFDHFGDDDIAASTISEEDSASRKRSLL
jgi:hypothetical protein